MNITLNSEIQPNVTVLSNDFITQHMVQADGEFVKIYLLLLHLIQSNAFTGIDQIADMLELTQKDVVRAIRYWECQGLLKLDSNLTEYATQEMVTETIAVKPKMRVVYTPKPVETRREPEQPVLQSVQQPAQKAVQPAENGMIPVPRKEDFSSAAYQASKEKSKLRHSIYMAEAYLGKPLTQTELNSFCYIDTALNFSPDLLEYLIEYCVSREKKNVRYMETVAINWYQHGIDTVEKAKNQSANYSQNVFGIMKAFGISNRNPGKLEMEYIRKWNKMGFTSQIIEEACSRTVLSVHQPSFQYANRILETWKNEGVSSLEDIRALDEKRRSSNQTPAEAPVRKNTNQFHNFEQRTYDYDTLESKLLHD